MMDCRRIEQSLIAYLDHRADPAVRRQVEQHLVVCDACRERAEGFRAVWSVLDDLPEIAPSRAFDAAVRERVSAAQGSAGSWAWLVPSPRLAFALASVMAVAVWLSFTRPAQEPLASVTPRSSEAEFAMIRDLPMLEDYDVLQGFDALSELPVQTPATREDSER